MNFLKKILVPTLSSFAAVSHKGHFRKILIRIIKLCCFSWYHVHIFEKKRIRTFDEEINAELVGNNLSSPKWKTEKIICPFLVALFMFFLFSGQFWTVETPSKSVLSRKISWFIQFFFFFDYQLGYTFFLYTDKFKIKKSRDYSVSITV